MHLLYKIVAIRSSECVATDDATDGEFSTLPSSLNSNVSHVDYVNMQVRVNDLIKDSVISYLKDTYTPAPDKCLKLTKAIESAINAQYAYLNDPDISPALKEYLQNNMINFNKLLVDQVFTEIPESLNVYIAEFEKGGTKIARELFDVGDVSSVDWKLRRSTIDQFFLTIMRSTAFPLLHLFESLTKSDESGNTLPLFPEHFDQMVTIAVESCRVILATDDTTDDPRDPGTAVMFNQICKTPLEELDNLKLSSVESDHPRTKLFSSVFSDYFELTKKCWKDTMESFKSLIDDDSDDSLSKVTSAFEALMSSNLVSMDINTESSEKFGFKQFYDVPIDQCFFEMMWALGKSELKQNPMDVFTGLFENKEFIKLSQDLTEHSNLLFMLINHVATLDGEVERGDFRNIILKIAATKLPEFLANHEKCKHLPEKERLPYYIDNVVVAKDNDLMENFELPSFVSFDAKSGVGISTKPKIFDELLQLIRVLTAQIFNSFYGHKDAMLGKYHAKYHANKDGEINKDGVSYAELYIKAEKLFSENTEEENKKLNGTYRAFQMAQDYIKQKESILKVVNYIIKDVDAVKEAYHMLEKELEIVRDLEEKITHFLTKLDGIEIWDEGKKLFIEGKVHNNPYYRASDRWIEVYWKYMASKKEKGGAY